MTTEESTELPTTTTELPSDLTITTTKAFTELSIKTTEAPTKLPTRTTDTPIAERPTELSTRTTDVSTELPLTTTEAPTELPSKLLLLENSHYTDQKSYKFEDFFWTGSGDGMPDENMWTSDGPTIIYKTSTVISTVFVATPSTHSTPSTPNCTFNCETPNPPNGNIDPTPTFTEITEHGNEIDDDFFDAGRQFWLVTVIRSDGEEPGITELKNSLTKLYKTAFQRQQAQHLGIIIRQKRAPTEKPVNVYIHKIDKQKVNGEDKIEVLYHVEVQGKPVDAYTAANDMKLVTDEEVRKELGYPFVIKAEPYLKATEPLGLSKAKNTWFVIGISIMGLLLILLVLAFLILGLAKKRKRSQQTSAGLENRKHIFERGVGHENKGLVRDDSMDESKRTHQEESPTYVHFGNKQTRASFILRPQSSASGASSSSSSLDISPLMNLSKKHKTPPKKPPRPRAALNKTAPLNTTVRRLPPEMFDSDSSTSRKDDSPDMGFGENMDPGVTSPKSYLSMPSVKSFPRTIMPEPLNKVLEPTSVTHLDMPEEEYSVPQKSYRKYGSETLVRHGSVGAVEDPGVLGPVVWNMHCERLRHGVSVDQGINNIRNDLNPPSNISRMRKRFHDLLDDTFSLFGNSRKGSPENTPVDDRSRPIAIEVKSHSANDNRPNEFPSLTIRPRPKTTGAKKPDHYSSGPSCAWSSTAPSPLIRALSADPRITSGATSNVHSTASSRVPTAPGEPSEFSRVTSGILKSPTAPRVNVEHILAEGKFRPSDPAISVIEAIKTELERVSLPGSTTELNK